MQSKLYYYPIQHINKSWENDIRIISNMRGTNYVNETSLF